MVELKIVTKNILLLHFGLKLKVMEAFHKITVLNQIFHRQSSAVTLNLKGKKQQPDHLLYQNISIVSHPVLLLVSLK